MEFVTEYLLPHWPFVVMALVLGSVGQVMRIQVWTKTRAASGKFWWWMRATMGVHAPLAGVALAGLGLLLFGDVPVSTGVEGTAAILLYYAGAGACSSWIFAAAKHGLKSHSAKELTGG